MSDRLEVPLPAEMCSEDQAGGLRLVNLPVQLQYPLLGYLGALSLAWLDTRVADALENADRVVQQRSAGAARVLVWDALRTRRCQREIWDRYARQLRTNDPSASSTAIANRVAGFVSDPCGVFRHGTGGAVDVTIFAGGREAWLGTRFDEFVPEAFADHFRVNPPVNEHDVEAHRNRELLRTAMNDAGFVVLPAEWWHFEFGTDMWAQAVGKPAFLREVLDAPIQPDCPADPHDVRRGLPSLVTGVAQAFQSSAHRQRALEGKVHAHYYARTSTPSRTALERLVVAL